MRYIILLLFFITSSFGVSINSSLLKIHATLVPKIYLMDHKYKEKADNNTIVIAILYNKSDKKHAQSLRDKMQLKYRDGINSYRLKIELYQYSQINNNSANIYYLFPTNSTNIKKTITKANSEQALTFSYLKSDLQYGVMISINIGNKVKPILNLDAIKKNNISLRSILLDISNIYLESSNHYLNYIDVNRFEKDGVDV